MCADVIITGNVPATPKKINAVKTPQVDKYGISEENVGDYTGFKVARKFFTEEGPKVFKGEVTAYTRFENREHLWHVKYEDDDSEELNYGELMALKDECTSAPPAKKKSRKVAMEVEEDDLPLLRVPPPTSKASPAPAIEIKREVLPSPQLRAAMHEVYGSKSGVDTQPSTTPTKRKEDSVKTGKMDAKRGVGAYGGEDSDDKTDTLGKTLPRGHNAPSIRLATKHDLKGFYIGGFTGFLHEDTSEVYKQPLSNSNVAIMYGVDTATNLPAALFSTGNHRAELSKRLLGAADAGHIVSLTVDRVKGRQRDSLMRPVFADRDIYEFTADSEITDIDTNEIGTVGECKRLIDGPQQ